jgi:hypothetical protein
MQISSLPVLKCFSLLSPSHTADDDDDDNSHGAGSIEESFHTIWYQELVFHTKL